MFLLTRGTHAVALEDTEMTARIECDSHLPAAELHPADADRTRLNHMLQNLPPCVIDRFGREGDMVNLVFVAQQNDLEAAFAGNVGSPLTRGSRWHSGIC